MENSTPGIVILVLTLLSFIGVAAWFIWAKLNWAWPKGTRVKAVFGDTTCTVILSKSAEEQVDEETAFLVARESARASHYLVKVWNESDIDKTYDPSDSLSHVVVHFLSEDEFGMPGAAAYLGKVSKRVGGDYLPSTVVLPKYTQLILDTGEPVIYEMLHQCVWDAQNDDVAQYDYGHQDPRVWLATGKEDSMQYKAREKFRTNGL